tara:strand:- start:1831 stop:2727 length:897 start_codon:yes stop_codon:yes gene_type:complete
MKNLEVVTQADEIHAYCQKLWRTDAFKKSYDTGGLVFEVVDKLASLPRYFYERSDDRLETGHFTSWWGGIQLRPNDYKQDGVHDVYYLHEMYHAATMPCCPDLIYGAFLQKLGNNESDASVCSEISAYFEMPELRKETFGFEIYADRFLKDPTYQALWQNNRREFEEMMIIKRRNVMHSTYQPQDMPEKWINLFSSQNKESGTVWTDSYNKIETAMWQLRVESIDSNIGRDQAMKNFMTWLTSDEITNGTDIPFPKEAEVFADIYWRNKKLYAQEVDAFVKQQNATAATPPQPKKPQP